MYLMTYVRQPLEDDKPHYKTGGSETQPDKKMVAKDFQGFLVQPFFLKQGNHIPQMPHYFWE